MTASEPSSITLGAADLFNVNGMVCVVTGGGTGIGLMMSKALAHNGAHKVFILGRRLPALEEAARAINRPSVVVPLVCDVTSQAALEETTARITSEVGYVNLLVCNSGISGPYGVKPTPEMTLDEFIDGNLASGSMEDYTSTFAVNASAVWYTTLSFLRLLDAGNKRQDSVIKSQVIATSSIGGFNKHNTGGWAYGQSKAACTHLIKQLASALPQWGIRANVICPGLYPSEMSAGVFDKAGGQFGSDAIPLQRPGDEKDMAGAILYLASRAGAYCNGTVVTTDGGRLGLFPSTF